MMGKKPINDDRKRYDLRKQQLGREDLDERQADLPLNQQPDDASDYATPGDGSQRPAPESEPKV